MGLGVKHVREVGTGNAWEGGRARRVVTQRGGCSSRAAADCALLGWPAFSVVEISTSFS